MQDRVLITRLYEKTSQFGNRYFIGRLGAARLVLLRDTHGADPNGWQLFTQTVEERPAAANGRHAVADVASRAAGAGGLKVEAEVLRAPAVRKPETSRPKLKLRFAEPTKPINGERRYSGRVPELDDFSGR
jgi:hypothetical protein